MRASPLFFLIVLAYLYICRSFLDTFVVSELLLGHIREKRLKASN